MKVSAIIPVRMGSSRFPGKPLAKINGLTMVEHVTKRVALCKSLNAGVYVATPDKEIAEEVERFGGQVIMTSVKHQRASDRIAEAAQQLDTDIVVMIQGDEPLVTPEMVEKSFQPMLKDESIFCTNLVKQIDSEEEYKNPNTIKVVIDDQGYALYFSREPIPTDHGSNFASIKAYKQVCIIPFTKKSLLEFAEMTPTSLEVAESIDMLRILQHGFKVMMVECTDDTHSVDVLADIDTVERMMQGDPLLPLYS